MINFKNKTKDQLDEYLYDRDLSIEEYIEFKKEYFKYDLSKFDKETYNDYINEKLNEFEYDKDKLLKYKKIFKENDIDIKYINTLIKLSDPITIDLIETLNKSDITKLLIRGGLDLNQLLALKKQMKNYNMDESDEELIDDYIYAKATDIKTTKEMRKYYTLSREYKIDTEALDKRADELVEEIMEENRIKKEQKKREKEAKRNKLGFFEMLFLGALLSPSKPNKKQDSNLEDWQQDLVNKGKYDTFNFEEQELEEDDYYYEDD